MKKIVLAAAILVMVLTAGAQAAADMAETSAPDIIYDSGISTNILTWFMTLYNFSYERMMGPGFSIKARTGYFDSPPFIYSSFLMFGIDMFFHPAGKGMAGWFLGPKYDVWLSNAGMFHWVGASGGYRLAAGEGLDLGISAGIAKVIARTYDGLTGYYPSYGGIEGGSSAGFDPYRDITLTIDLEIGWLFTDRKNPGPERGANKAEYENCISTNALSWPGVFPNLGYERIITPLFSVRPRIAYFGADIGGGGTFYTVGMDAFFHPEGKGISGWFFGPRYDVWIGSGRAAYGRWLQKAGFMAGYRHVHKNGFVSGVSIGAQLNISDLVFQETGSYINGYNFPYDAALIAPALDIEIGWAL